MNDIASRILRAMESQRCSYGELSKITGIPKSALQRYATGETDKIPLDRLEKIASALHISAAYLMGWEDETAAPPVPTISDEAHHIGVLYDRADEKDRLLTHTVLDKYDEEINTVSTKTRNPGGIIELDVYDEPAAAGWGNYLDGEEKHREQFPSVLVPKGADFGIRITGNSMTPVIEDGMTVFVKHTMKVESGKVGVFVLNGASYCKQLIVDRDRQQVRLHSFNANYSDIIISPSDSLVTIGQVL